ncbi:MAG: tyrosine-type recombinase/integrase [Proteobacteria bacterium]|nr:tyrosine-type recombinase/integrase [Pseudomonadota bacterium]
MTIHKLTISRLNSLQPREKPYRVPDGAGLCIEITPSGSKLWKYRYRVAGAPRLISLGRFPYLTLEGARRAHFEARSLVLAGTDPVATQRAKRSALEVAKSGDFEVFARAWLAQKKATAAPKTFQKMTTIVVGDLIPLLGHTRIETLRTPDAVSALDAIAARAPHMAQKAQSYLAQMVDHAIKKGLREDGKLLSLRGTVALPKATSVPAVITKTGLRRVLQLIAEVDDPILEAALQTAALTSLRPSNVVSARWSMMDLETNTWTIPGNEMKVGEEHTIPITRQLCAIFELAATWRVKDNDYIFPAISMRKTPHLHRDTLSKALRNAGLKGEQTPHGFRATFRSIAREEFDEDIDVLEAQLAHTVGNQTQRAYNRTKLLARRAVVMQQWADLLDDLLKADQAAEVEERSNDAKAA